MARTEALYPMDEQTINARAAVMHCVDTQECGSCGREIPMGAAENARWFVDTMPQPDGSILAEIRCPACW